MDDNILDILGLQLVDYFISQQQYTPFNVSKKIKSHNSSKGEVYLTNKDSNTYHIIKIIKENNFTINHFKNKKDEVYEILCKQLENDGIKEVRFLMIILNDNSANENRMSPAIDVIIATPDKIVGEIAKFYPNITKSIKIDLPETTNNEDNSNNENSNVNNDEQSSGSHLSEKWKKVNFQNRRYLSDTLKKCSNANLAVTWFLFIIPIITYFIILIIVNFSKDSWFSINFNLQKLVFGANYYNLIFGAHEYWRWLTYPFAGNDSGGIIPINLIFSLWMFYRVGRFIEGFYGWWKALIIWFGAMVMIGILQSVVDHYNIMSGFWVFAWISLGAMLPFIWNYKLFKTPIMNRFTVTIVLMLIFWFLFDEKIITLLYWMIAFALGWLFASIVGYYNRKITLFYAFSPVALGAVILFSALVYLLNNFYAVDDNNYTLNVLEQYKVYGLISQSTINSIMNNFFHYNL